MKGIFRLGLAGALIATASAAGPDPRAADKITQAIEAQKHGWLRSSRKLLEEAAALDPNARGLKYFRAVQELREGNPEKAAAFARSSLLVGQQPAECHTLLGLLALQDKDLSEAERHMRAALAADPENGRASYNLSEVLRYRGQPREALVQLNLALQKQPEDPILKLKIRLTQIETGERTTFVRPAEARSDDPAWVLTQAALAMHDRKYDHAAILLAQARSAFTPQVFYPLLAGDHFFQAHASEPALADFFDKQP